MRNRLAFLLIASAIATTAIAQRDGSVTDTRNLGMALDYFAGGKYHEALTLFNKLDGKYKLNPRFKAYIGICYYHVWDFEQACRYLDEAIPNIGVYAPHERSIYYNAAAESHFELKEYDKAVPLYEQQLLVCYDNEKGDAFYRLGFCHMFNENWQNAADYFNSALAYYTRFPRQDTESRISQLKNMITGCEKKVEEEKASENGILSK